MLKEHTAEKTPEDKKIARANAIKERALDLFHQFMIPVFAHSNAKMRDKDMNESKANAVRSEFIVESEAAAHMAFIIAENNSFNKVWKRVKGKYLADD